MPNLPLQFIKNRVGDFWLYPVLNGIENKTSGIKYRFMNLLLE